MPSLEGDRGLGCPPRSSWTPRSYASLRTGQLCIPAETGWAHPRGQPGPVQALGPGHLASRPQPSLPAQRSREERGRSRAERCGLEGPEALGPTSSVTGAGTNALHIPHPVAWVSAITSLPAPRWITDIRVTLGGSCQTSEPLPGELA